MAEVLVRLTGSFRVAAADFVDLRVRYLAEKDTVCSPVLIRRLKYKVFLTNCFERCILYTRFGHRVRGQVVAPPVAVLLEIIGDPQLSQGRLSTGLSLWHDEHRAFAKYPSLPQ